MQVHNLMRLDLQRKRVSKPTFATSFPFIILYKLKQHVPLSPQLIAIHERISDPGQVP